MALLTRIARAICPFKVCPCPEICTSCAQRAEWVAAALREPTEAIGDEAWIAKRAAALKADTDVGAAMLDGYAMGEIKLALREAIARGRADTTFATKDGNRYTVLDGRPG